MDRVLIEIIVFSYLAGGLVILLIGLTIQSIIDWLYMFRQSNGVCNSERYDMTVFLYTVFVIYYSPIILVYRLFEHVYTCNLDRVEHLPPKPNEPSEEV